MQHGKASGIEVWLVRAAPDVGLGTIQASKCPGPPGPRAWHRPPRPARQGASEPEGPHPVCRALRLPAGALPFTRQSTEAGACRGPPAAKCNDKTQQPEQRGSLTGVPLLAGRSKLQACARCTDTLFEQKKRARRTWDAQLLLGRPGLFAYRCQGKCDATRARSMRSPGRQGEPCHRVHFVLGRPPMLRRGATDERTTSASECTMSQRHEAAQTHPLRATQSKWALRHAVRSSAAEPNPRRLTNACERAARQRMRGGVARRLRTAAQLRAALLH
jgi:hypothetical protein